MFFLVVFNCPLILTPPSPINVIFHQLSFELYPWEISSCWSATWWLLAPYLAACTFSQLCLTSWCPVFGSTLLMLLHQSWQRKAGMLGEPGDAGRCWELSSWMQGQSNSNGGAQHRDVVIYPVFGIKTSWSIKCLIASYSIPELLLIIRQKLLSKIFFIFIPSLIFKITHGLPDIFLEHLLALWKSQHPPSGPQFPLSSSTDANLYQHPWKKWRF